MARKSAATEAGFVKNEGKWRDVPTNYISKGVAIRLNVKREDPLPPKDALGGTVV